MPQLHYLTVQDILWINLQATKKVQHFSYARLEEATYYQYAYGDSNELLPQAARFLSGFAKMRPLEAGNEATAFIAVATFLAINGSQLCVSDARAWFDSAYPSIDAARLALERAVKVDPHHHAELKPDVRAAVRAVMDRYPAALFESAAV